MKRMGGILLVGLLLTAFLPAGAWAKVVEPWEARDAGENFLNQITRTDGGWGMANDAYVLDCVEFTGERGRLGYFIPVHPKGYIMVSLMTQILPIKAWSAECDLDISEEGGMAQLLRDAMGRPLDYLEETYGSLDQVPEEEEGISFSSNRKEWDFLWGKGPRPLGENGEPRSPGYNTGALLSTAWHQNTPYNNYCPLGCNRQRTVVGCVATAASQIMKYWNYPYSGWGSNSYVWAGDDCCTPSVPGTTLSATFNTYDWTNMLNSYAGSYNATQAAAVAKLCYEVGIAFYMDYGVCGSGAWQPHTVWIFPENFRYAYTTACKDGCDYTSDGWFEAIKKELDGPLPRPMMYGIENHSIVCDGYRTDPSDQIHINYGHANSNTNWWTVDAIPGSGGHLEDGMVTGIQPHNRLYFIVKGMSNSIYQQYMKSNGTLQGSWQSIPGGTSHAPALAIFNNRLYAAVKGSTNNYVYVSSRDGSSSWTSWMPMPGLTNCSPALAAFNNRLYLAVKGAGNNNIYLNSMNSSGVWGSWTTVAGLTGDSPALAFYNGKLYLVVKGATNNKIYSKTMTSDGVWSSWETLSGATNVAPALAVFNDRLYLAVKGATNNNIYYTYNWGYWSPQWYSVAGLTSTSPALAAIPETNQLYLAVKGATNNQIYTKYRTAGGYWSDSWTVVPGLTTDTPSIHVFYYYNP